MTGPCLCGDPYCPRCFNQRDRLLAEIEGECGVSHADLRTLLDCFAGSIQSDASEGSLWRQFQREVEITAADMAADEADSRAEREIP